ncbi:hypothetical protein GCM10027075_52190 [Streptomyces heilongjiangensis]
MASDSGHGGPRHAATLRTAGRTPAAPPHSGDSATPSPLPEAARHRTTRRRPSTPAERTPRPRVEVHVNELTGTMSWRTLDDDRAARSARASAAYAGQGAPGPRRARAPLSRLPGEAPWSARAAALRSAGLDPARAPARGAAPVPTHPAAVRAALGVDAASLGPERLAAHLARIGALRSAVAADLARGSRMPAAVASRLRSTTTTPALAHALTAERAAAVPRTSAAAATRPPTPVVRPASAPGPGVPHRR